jgi:hypothetical protein
MRDLSGLGVVSTKQLCIVISFTGRFYPVLHENRLVVVLPNIQLRET